FYTIHSDLDALFGKGKKKNKLITKYCIKNKFMIPIALHDEMKNDTNKLFNINKTLVLENGIDLKKMHEVSVTQKEILSKLGIPTNSFVIGHVGRFHPVKNHQFIIKVFKNILEHKNNAHLLLIGSGDTKSNIKRLVLDNKIENKVTF